MYYQTRRHDLGSGTRPLRVRFRAFIIIIIMKMYIVQKYTEKWKIKDMIDAQLHLGNIGLAYP